MSTEADIVERMTAQAADGVDFHGETMKQWDKIRGLCAKRDGSDLPRLMFEGLIESFADLLTEGAAEITKLRAERDAAAREMRERAVAAVEKLYWKNERIHPMQIRHALQDLPVSAAPADPVIATDRESQK